MNTRIEGVMPVILMPYTDAGRVDEDDVASQVDHMYDVGCDGFVVGQVSESVGASASFSGRLYFRRRCRPSAMEYSS